MEAWRSIDFSIWTLMLLWRRVGMIAKCVERNFLTKRCCLLMYPGKLALLSWLHRESSNALYVQNFMFIKVIWWDIREQTMVRKTRNGNVTSVKKSSPTNLHLQGMRKRSTDVVLRYVWIKIELSIFEHFFALLWEHLKFTDVSVTRFGLLHCWH